MSKVLITRSKLDGLASTIAAKSGATLPLTIDQMDAAVDGIVVGSGVDTSGDTVDAAHLLDGYTAHDSTGAAITGSYTPPTFATQAKSATPTESQQTVTPDTGYDGLSSVTVAAMPAGSATPPTTISGSQATLTTGTNTITLQKTLSVTPRVTAGYVASGTADSVLVSLNANVTTQAAQTIYPSATDQTIAASRYLTGAQTIKAVTTSNLTAANIKQGVTVTVGDSADADRVLSVTGTYSGGGGSVSIDTKTVTASNYPVSVSFSSMEGEPKAFFLRSTSQISSSGSTTYYYITDMVYDGNANHYCDGNCFRIGSTRRVDPVTTTASGGVVSGYSWSYSGTTLTITSSAASRSASPGAFNNGYQLVYVY